MARLIKNVKSITLGVTLSTVHEDSTVDRHYKIGDVVEGLRYVENEEIKTVSGKITDITYTMASKISWNKKNPTNALPVDMILGNIIIDASEKFESNIVTVPIKEIVEFADETDVTRMKYTPFIVCDMEMHYSDLSVKNVSVQVGDSFDHVRIIDPANIGTDFIGRYQIIGFAYTVVSGKINITGIAFQNLDTMEFLVTDFGYILNLNEVYSYDITDGAAIEEVLSKIADGDSIVIDGSVDTTGHLINITKKDIYLTINEDLVADGGNVSGIKVSGGGKLTISGSGKIVNNTPYDNKHSSGVVKVVKDSELVINDGGVQAVIETDPAGKGQFGICVYENAALTINGGEFTTGWYCVSGNGNAENKDSVITINDGVFKSIADYAIYHPQNGKLVINGGDISGAAGALAVNNGEIEINGGVFSVLGNGNTGNWGDGTSGLTDVAINLNAKYGDVTCRITGGDFYATEAGTILIAVGSAHNVDLKITGGRFTAKPEAAWVPEGYFITEEKESDGFYHVYKELTA